MSSILGITGRAGSGKDTFGSVFVKAGYRRIAFADPLKEATAIIAGEPSHLYFTAEGKEGFSDVLNMTRRRALQDVGNGLRKALDPGIWVRRALHEWDCQGRPLTVITDVRYDNEAELIRSMGGAIIEIVRPDNAYLEGDAAQHASEQGISSKLVDLYLTNDTSIGELQAEARKIIAALRTPAGIRIGGHGAAATRAGDLRHLAADSLWDLKGNQG